MFQRPLQALGFLLCIFGALEFGFGFIELVFRDGDWEGFMLSAFVALAIGGGLMLAFWKPWREDSFLDHRSAFILTAASWTVLPVITALPFWFSRYGVSFTDAVFETTSGLTTTGSSVLTGLDGLDPMFLLWRSFLQWIGGVGIVLMAIIMLPFLRVGGMQLFRLENTSRSEGNLIDRPTEVIRAIASIYLTLSLLCMSAYTLAGMSLFDAVNHAMTTVSTGGFSTHDASMGFFNSPAIEWIAVVFMICGALPFVMFLRAFSGDTRAAVNDPQTPVFLAVVGLFTIAVAAALEPQSEGVFEALRRAAFNVVSIITTTGYAVEDYQLWGAGFIGVFFALTFFGGCAGSTAGGIKIYRFQLLRTFAAEHLRRLYSPSLVETHSYGGAKLTPDIATGVLAFLALFVAAFSIGAALLSVTGLDLVTALSASATALCNVGPGFGEIIGPAGNFADLPDASKWVLIALMLLGRLELFAVLVFFDPYFWR
ncbi:MAG: TrkH family potassium uptake protein [Parvularculaceae bacterium]